MKKIISNNMLLFAKRNTLNFFRDKASVFFSLLSALIIIALYVLFLGDMLVQGFKSTLGENARFIIDSWIMAGVISITSITTAMGAFGAIVDDKTNKTLKDFYSAPISRKEIAGGYILSSFIIGTILTTVSLIFAKVYILAYGGSLLPFLSYLKIFGIIILSVLSSCTFMFYIVSFFKTASSFSTGSTILGTLLGFLTGVYIPTGQLPEAVQAVIKVIPVSHSAVLLRGIMTENALNTSLIGANAEQVKGFNVLMGIQFEAFGVTLTPLHSILFLVATTALFFTLAVLKISKKQKK